MKSRQRGPAWAAPGGYGAALGGVPRGWLCGARAEAPRLECPGGAPRRPAGPRAQPAFRRFLWVVHVIHGRLYSKLVVRLTHLFVRRLVFVRPFAPCCTYVQPSRLPPSRA